MDPKSYQRFLRLRQSVMQKIKAALEDDPYCKSYEGAFELIFNFPNYFDDQDGTQAADAYGIRLHCYVLGPHRHYEWWGSTLEAALTEAEEAIQEWGLDE